MGLNDRHGDRADRAGPLRPKAGGRGASAAGRGVPDDLCGLGPKSRDLLRRAGIDTLTRLRELGTVAAYVAVKRAGGKPSLNLLWGLEAVIRGQHWREVARQHRASLLLALETAEVAGRGPIPPPRR